MTIKYTEHSFLFYNSLIVCMFMCTCIFTGLVYKHVHVFVYENVYVYVYAYALVQMRECVCV